MRIYIFNQRSLSYDKITQKQVIFSIAALFIFGLGSFFAGTLMGVTKFTKELNSESLKHDMMSKYDVNPEHNAAWKDSVFADYAVRADVYLSRPKFKGTPLKGEMMALCARNAYDSTGILVPVELALSQAYWESSMGMEGRSPENNPFNIGEHDSGTVKWFNSTFEGTQAYYHWMCRKYLSCKSIDELFVNFSNCSGHRYASTPNYEEHIRNQYYAIKKWINVALKQK